MEVIVIGAGGFAKQVIDGFRLSGINIKGLVDDVSTNNLLGCPIIGKIEDLNIEDQDIKIFCAIGDVKIRKDIYCRFSSRMINCIHPTAVISPYTIIGTGNYIGPGSCIMPGVLIGNNNIIDSLSVISHDCKIGNNNHLAGHSCLLGKVSIDDCNLIGANSTILPKLTLGSNVILGAGAVLTKSIDNDKIMVGVPAREQIH